MNDKLHLAAALSKVRVGVQMAGTLVDPDGTARIELLERLDEGWRNITLDELATTPDVAERFDDLVVTRDVPPTVDADILPGLRWFTSSHGVAVSWVDPVTDRGPALIADGIVLPPNTAAAVREFFCTDRPWPSERRLLSAWMRSEGTRPAISNSIARIVSRVYAAWHGGDAWVPFSLRYSIAHEIQRAGLTDTITEVHIIDGELARDDAHHDLLPLPIAFATRAGAEAYIAEQGALYGSHEIRRVDIAADRSV